MPPQIAFACPGCHGPLAANGPDEWVCTQEGLAFARIEGSWRFLLPGRAGFFEQFSRDYQAIRQAEGRGSPTADYYRALPYRDLTGTMSGDWHIRAASFEALLRQVILPLEKHTPALAVLDLGAGNGWLSNRLALRGHRLAAVDLMTNSFDGLGCLRFYESEFSAVQAEFERLPFPNGCIDLAIFNASLHYTLDAQKTLVEALRTLKPGGKLVVLDSPVYRQAASGAQMVREREAQFTRRFGFPSNTLASINYLTYAQLNDLEKALGLRWQLSTPFYGFGWLLRPWLARLRGSREPASFHLIVGEK